MHPKNKLLRAYLLGVITGMGAAVAYLWGLSRHSQQYYQWCAFQASALRDKLERAEEQEEEEETDV